MPLRDDDVRAQLRAMQLGWGVLLGGVAAAAVIALLWVYLSDPPLAAIRSTLFYTSALVNVAALIWAFAMQYHLRSAIERETSPAGRISVTRELGRKAILPLAAAGFFAAASAFATGELIHLAFLIPIFGFGVLFFPTDSRATHFLRVPR